MQSKCSHKQFAVLQSKYQVLKFTKTYPKSSPEISFWGLNLFEISSQLFFAQCNSKLRRNELDIDNTKLMCYKAKKFNDRYDVMDVQLKFNETLINTQKILERVTIHNSSSQSRKLNKNPHQNHQLFNSVFIACSASSIRRSLAHWFVTLRLSLNKDFSKW
jgi:hypothetical protein